MLTPRVAGCNSALPMSPLRTRPTTTGRGQSTASGATGVVTWSPAVGEPHDDSAGGYEDGGDAVNRPHTAPLQPAYTSVRPDRFIPASPTALAQQSSPPTFTRSASPVSDDGGRASPEHNPWSLSSRRAVLRRRRQAKARRSKQRRQDIMYPNQKLPHVRVARPKVPATPSVPCLQCRLDWQYSLSHGHRHSHFEHQVRGFELAARRAQAEGDPTMAFPEEQ